MNELSFGQYYPSKSFVHRLDPRVKILLLGVYIAALFVGDSFYTQGACALALLLTIAFSGVPLRALWRSLRGILLLLVFMSALNLFFSKGGEPLYDLPKPWKWLIITDKGLMQTAYIAIRMVLLVLGSSILTLTTTPVALSDGIESLLFPLKLIRIPVHAFALIVSISLKYISTFTDDTNRIMNAQKARGAELESNNLIKKVKALVTVLIPLILSAFRRADELGDAMEARCYSGSNVRTRYKKLTVGWRDWISLFVGACLLAGVIVLRVL